MTRSSLVALLTLALLGCRAQKPRTEPTSSATVTRALVDASGEVPVGTRYEVTFDVLDRTVDPDDVAILATVSPPSGPVLHVGGYAAHGRYHVRFTPRVVGPHVIAIRADGGGGLREVAHGVVRATPGRQRGFTTIDPQHPHRLVAPDGSTVLVLGENRINVYDPSWNEDHADIPTYVARMAAYGMRTIRVFVFSDCKSETAPDGYQLGCLEPALGRFDERTADAFDSLFAAAEQNDVDVILVPFAIGFTPAPETWRSWDDNPYSAARGGPAKEPIDFFRSEDVRLRAMRRFKYVADRWGSSPRLLAIDVLNEPEWDGPIPENVWIPWAEKVSRDLRALDPYGHLVTAGSVGLQSNIGGDETPWYGSRANDMVQWHLYGKETYDPFALGPEMARKVDETWTYKKPVFCGEFAYGGEEKPQYEHTHVGIWALLMSGAGALAHTAPQFQIDSDEPMTPARAAHFKVLSEFMRSLGRDVALTPVRDVKAQDVTLALSLVSDDRQTRAIWLLTKNALGPTPVSFPSPPSGNYRVTWVDDVTGKPLADNVIRFSGGETATLMSPPFVSHVAARLTPADRALP